MAYGGADKKSVNTGIFIKIVKIPPSMKLSQDMYSEYSSLLSILFYSDLSINQPTLSF